MAAGLNVHRVVTSHEFFSVLSTVMSLGSKEDRHLVSLSVCLAETRWYQKGCKSFWNRIAITQIMMSPSPHNLFFSISDTKQIIIKNNNVRKSWLFFWHCEQLATVDTNKKKTWTKNKTKPMNRRKKKRQRNILSVWYLSKIRGCRESPGIVLDSGSSISTHLHNAVLRVQRGGASDPGSSGPEFTHSLNIHLCLIGTNL